MPFGVSTAVLVAALFGVVAVGGVLQAQRYRSELDEIRDARLSEQVEFEADEWVKCRVDDVPDDEVGSVEIPQPDLSGGRFGIISRLWALHKHNNKIRRLGRKGYVQWYLVGDTWDEPKFIKPQEKAGGVAEYEYKGNTYLFPKRAMQPSPVYGIQTIIHKRGSADPINLDEPDEYAVPPDVLNEWLSKRVTASAPSLLDQYDIDAGDAIKIAIAVIIVAAGEQQYLG